VKREINYFIILIKKYQIKAYINLLIKLISKTKKRRKMEKKEKKRKKIDNIISYLYIIILSNKIPSVNMFNVDL
jgi:hypothetical protein